MTLVGKEDRQGNNSILAQLPCFIRIHTLYNTVFPNLLHLPKGKIFENLFVDRLTNDTKCCKFLSVFKTQNFKVYQK